MFLTLFFPNSKPKGAPEIDLSEMNSVKNVIEYGMVIGKVKPNNLELKSNYKSEISGVIRLLKIIEHGELTKNGVKSNTKSVISNTTNEVPFHLVNNQNSFSAHISQPLKSFYLTENLEVSHSIFEPVKESIGIVNNVITNSAKETASVSSETLRIRGIETIEKMLKNGAQLTCFAKIEKIQSVDKTNSWWSIAHPYLNYKISEPADDYTFIVTPLSKEALLDKLRSNAGILKVFLAVNAIKFILFLKKIYLKF